MPSHPVEVPVPVVPYELPNKFLLVTLAVQRAKQLHNGARPRVETDGHKSNWVASQEVAAGRVSWSLAEKPPTKEA